MNNKKNKHEGFKNPLKFSLSEKRNIYFTSDTHFYHDAEWIVEDQGYTNVKTRDESIIESINEVVKERDILFHLGDFSVNSNAEETKELLNKINCNRVYFIWGNHDDGLREIQTQEIKHAFQTGILLPDQNKSIELYPSQNTQHGFTMLGHYKEIEIDGQEIVLSHYPLYIWNQCQRGSWCLCGHSHYTCPETKSENPEGKILDVGWDGYKKVLSFDDLKKIMKNKKHVLRDKSH